MKFFQLFVLALSLGLADAYLVSPPGTPAPGAADACSAWVESSYGMTCDIIRRFYGLSQGQLEKWNPSVGRLGDGCSLIDGLYYCVQVNYITQTPTWTPPPTSTSTTSSSTPTESVPTPTPTRAGMVGNCNDFYLVVAGDTCYDIAAVHGIALDDFYDWNPAVGTSCGSLWVDYYICVGVATTTTTTPTTTTTTTTTPGNGISTPTPTRPGMTSNCDEFHLVVSGDGCYDIAAAARIPLDDFYAWNPAVGDDCSSLWADYYVCVGIIGTPPTTTTTTTGNGIATPTPTQAGMVASCNEFYLVVSGDGCWAVANQAGIALEDFYAWNPAVGDTCGALWPDYYVCIGVV